MNFLLEDAKQRPELFHWFGAIEPMKLRMWTDQNQIVVPPDLAELWIATGGGDFFETETILGPFADERLGDQIMAANRFHREQGMDEQLLLFHVGVIRSAIDRSTFNYITMNSNYSQLRSFLTFNEWYYSIRRDFAETYGLTKLAVIR